jgi:hypothetical protein
MRARVGRRDILCTVLEGGGNACIVYVHWQTPENVRVTLGIKGIIVQVCFAAKHDVIFRMLHAIVMQVECILWRSTSSNRVAATTAVDIVQDLVPNESDKAIARVFGRWNGLQFYRGRLVTIVIAKATASETTRTLVFVLVASLVVGGVFGTVRRKGGIEASITSRAEKGSWRHCRCRWVFQLERKRQGRIGK